MIPSSVLFVSSLRISAIPPNSNEQKCCNDLLKNIQNQWRCNSTSTSKDNLCIKKNDCIFFCYYCPSQFCLLLHHNRHPDRPSFPLSTPVTPVAPVAPTGRNEQYRLTPIADRLKSYAGTDNWYFPPFIEVLIFSEIVRNLDCSLPRINITSSDLPPYFGTTCMRFV